MRFSPHAVGVVLPLNVRKPLREPYKYCARDISRWLDCLVSERDKVKVVFDGNGNGDGDGDADGDMVGS